VDIAVKAAQKAFDTVWGLNASGAQRSRILHKLADLMEAHTNELAALEALDNGAGSWVHEVLTHWLGLGSQARRSLGEER
jgi:aldehyde dehydrogenase (NAD+)